MIEGVVAAFLMVFAFAAATALFDASLKWEAQGSNVRRASLVAERALGELRAELDAATSGNFDGAWASVARNRTYPDSPGFEVEFDIDLPTYKRHSKAPFSGSIPDGAYSPSSHLWVPASFASANPPLPPLPDRFDNPQKDEEYRTYARARSMPKSFRRVQVIVRYGDPDSPKEYRMVTLVGDPLPSGKPAATFSRMAGPATLNVDQAADYTVTLRVGGQVVDDIVCLWGVDLKGTAALVVKPHDSTGRAARVWRHPNATAGSSRLFVRGRYRGEEFTLYSDPVRVN